MSFDSNLYAQRRAQLAAHMAAQAPNSIAIIPTAPERQRNRDSDFLFRHDSYFYYFNNFGRQISKFINNKQQKKERCH